MNRSAFWGAFGILVVLFGICAVAFSMLTQPKAVPEPPSSPVANAVLVATLGRYDDPAETPNYLVANDGPSAGAVLVRTKWKWADIPDAKALIEGQTWLIENNWFVQMHAGYIYLWQVIDTATPMPTPKLGNPCTLTFVTCPPMPTP